MRRLVPQGMLPFFAASDSASIKTTLLLLLSSCCYPQSHCLEYGAFDAAIKG
jgi:hypothetical protein